MNKLSDYIVKYCSDEDIDYLRKILRSETALDFNFNDKMARSVLTDMAGDMRFLSIFHKLFKVIINEQIPINGEILSGIKVFNEGYFELKKKFERIESKISNSRVLSESEVLNRLSERVSGLNVDLDSHPYREEALKVIKDKDTFSLREEFDLEKGRYYPTDLNAATLITPVQTVSRFNDTKVNGLVGSGNHDDNFRDITKAIYGKDFGLLGQSGQDIKIRYVNNVRNLDNPFMITVEIPIFINSSQKKSLELLNEEIKKFEKTISVNAIIVDYDEGFHNALTIEDEVNLDAILSRVNVDDYHEVKYQDAYLVGYVNNENHFECDYRLDVGSKEDYNNKKNNYYNSNPNLRVISGGKDKQL